MQLHSWAVEHDLLVVFGDHLVAAGDPAGPVRAQTQLSGIAARLEQICVIPGHHAQAFQHAPAACQQRRGRDERASSKNPSHKQLRLTKQSIAVALRTGFFVDGWPGGSTWSFSPCVSSTALLAAAGTSSICQ